MKTLGNILWHIPFLGFVTAIIVYLIGLLLVVLVVTAPLGMGLMQIGKFLFWPFGNTLIKNKSVKQDKNQDENMAWKSWSVVITLCWLPFGLILTVFAAFQAVFLMVTIIGIPVGVVICKSLGAIFNPVDSKCVSSTMAKEIERRAANNELDAQVGV